MELLTRDSFGLVGTLTASLVLGLTTITLLLVYSMKKQNYWKNVGVPYLKPYPIFGSVVELLFKPIHVLENERYKKLGRIYGHFEGNRALLSVAEPELLRSILIKDFHAFSGRRRIDTGDEMVNKMVSSLQADDWKRVRTIISPTFTTGKIKRMMGIFKECAGTLVKNFRVTAEKGEYIEAKRLYGAFTMDIIASSAFSTKVDSHNDPNNEFVLTAKQAFKSGISWRFLLFIAAPAIAKLFRATLFAPNVINFFSRATLQIIEERKKTGQTRNDFLQLLMDTAKEVEKEGKLDAQEKENDITENYASEENKEIFKNITKKTLSFDELLAQCIIFFIAGYETTASTLAFCTYNFAVHPEIQERVIDEIDDAIKKHNGELTYEAVQSMKTLDNFISETLRLYPPGIRLERVADENYKLGDTGITIPKGMIVTIPVYAIHRDPEHFSDPEKFDPDRFTREERAKRHQYAYMPFGVGPRNCVAMRFALMEIKVCLAHVLCNFRIKRCSETKVPLEFHPSQGILQPKDINVKFEIRKDNVK